MRAWRLLPVLVLAACTADPAPTPPPAPVDREAQADWAVRTLDPCALLGSPGTIATPHSCEIKHDNGRHVTVHVGGAVNHFARYRSQPHEEAGLRAYLSYDPGRPGQPVSCQLAIPLSSTRAVWVTAKWAKDTTYEQECAAARTELRTVAQRLRDNPAALATGQGTLARWGACELLERTLGRPPADPAMENIRAAQVGDPSSADDCEWGDYRFDGIRLVLRVGTPPTDGQPMRLGEVTARQHTYPTGFCTLIWPQDTRTDGAANLAVLHGERCDRLTEAATKIRAVLAGPVPSVSPAPASLGIPPGEPDHAGEQVCQIVSRQPEPSCRAHKNVPVPSGSEAIMRMAATADSVDLACTLLADAIRSATGQDGHVGYTRDGCLGTTADRNVEFRLELDPSAGLSKWDQLGSRISIAGFPAIAWDRRANRDLALSDTADANRIGRVFLQAHTTAPLGEVTSKLPDDPARLAIADRVAEALLSRF